MKNTTTVIAKNSGRYGSTNIVISVKMVHSELSRDEGSRVQATFTNGLIKLLLENTNAKDIKIR